MVIPKHELAVAKMQRKIEVSASSCVCSNCNCTPSCKIIATENEMLKNIYSD